MALFKTNEQEYRLGTCSNPFEEIITRYAIKSDNAPLTYAWILPTHCWCSIDRLEGQGMYTICTPIIPWSACRISWKAVACLSIIRGRSTQIVTWTDRELWSYVLVMYIYLSYIRLSFKWSKTAHTGSNSAIWSRHVTSQRENIIFTVTSGDRAPVLPILKNGQSYLAWLHLKPTIAVALTLDSCWFAEPLYQSCRAIV